MNIIRDEKINIIRNARLHIIKDNTFISILENEIKANFENANVVTFKSRLGTETIIQIHMKKADIKKNKICMRDSMNLYSIIDPLFYKSLYNPLVNIFELMTSPFEESELQNNINLLYKISVMNDNTICIHV